MRQRSFSRGKPRDGGQPEASALAVGLGLLSRRAHSRMELKRKLGRRGYSEEQTEAALTRLSELRYLDDQSFAHGLVRRRGAVRGPMALSAELAARGVERAQADAAVAAFEPAAQLAAATLLAERLYARKAPATYREMLEAVGSKLLRRGFPSTIVRAACRAVLAGTSGEPED